jgi:hypothetical protein
MTERIVRSCFLVAVMLAVLAGSGARGQAPAGFELALVEVDIHAGTAWAVMGLATAAPESPALAATR